MKRSTLILMGLIFLASSMQLYGQTTTNYDARFQSAYSRVQSMTSLDPALKTRLLDLIVCAHNLTRIIGAPFDAVDHAIGAVEYLIFDLYFRETTNSSDKAGLDQIWNDLEDIITEAFKAAGLAVPQPVAPPPPTGCSCTIYVRVGKKMQAFKGAFHTKTGDFENFQVICFPPGGTFSWNFTPQAQAGIASATSTKLIGNTSTFVAEKSGSYSVTATYTAPDGSKCEVTQRLVVQ